MGPDEAQCPREPPWPTNVRSVHALIEGLHDGTSGSASRNLSPRWVLEDALVVRLAAGLHHSSIPCNLIWLIDVEGVVHVMNGSADPRYRAITESVAAKPKRSTPSRAVHLRAANEIRKTAPSHGVARMTLVTYKERAERFGGALRGPFSSMRGM